MEKKICAKCNGIGKVQSRFIGLTEPIDNRWGLKFAGGSMGLSLPAAVGFALAKKLKGEEGNVYVLMSDGECQIGTFYESILIAKQHNLSNLIVFIDNNFWQAMGRTKDILNIESLDERIKSFGWNVKRIDGHDYFQIDNIWEWINKDCPNMIICETTKGKGVSFMENNNLFHYKAPNEEEYNLALKEPNV